MPKMTLKHGRGNKLIVTLSHRLYLPLFHELRRSHIYCETIHISGPHSSQVLCSFNKFLELSSHFVCTSLPPHGVSDEIYDMIKFVHAEAGYVADTSDIGVVWPVANSHSCR